MKKQNYTDSLKKGMRVKKEILLLVLFMVSSQVIAQFALEKYTINSGGSTMTGGSYQLSSSIGQVDASNAMNGGSYTLTGGFWSQSTNTPNELIFTNGFE